MRRRHTIKLAGDEWFLLDAAIDCGNQTVAKLNKISIFDLAAGFQN